MGVILFMIILVVAVAVTVGVHGCRDVIGADSGDGSRCNCGGEGKGVLLLETDQCDTS